jgi:hypothetical protein
VYLWFSLRLIPYYQLPSSKSGSVHLSKPFSDSFLNFVWFSARANHPKHRNLGDTHPIEAYDKRWESLKKNIPIFKFKSTNTQEFEDYYSRPEELLESEMHPFRPEFRHAHLSLGEMTKALKNFLAKHS